MLHLSLLNHHPHRESSMGHVDWGYLRISGTFIYRSSSMIPTMQTSFHRCLNLQMILQTTDLSLFRCKRFEAKSHLKIIGSQYSQYCSALPIDLNWPKPIITVFLLTGCISLIRAKLFLIRKWGTIALDIQIFVMIHVWQLVIETF